MALLHVLSRVAKEFELRVVAHGVDHGLRPAAARELDLAEAFASGLAIAFDRTRVEVAPGGNLQARARKARWEALVAVARRHDAAITTAHHADDRAETLLIRLLRGAGARGLGVLPPRARAPLMAGEREREGERPLVVRPLLRARRSDIMRHVERHQIACAEDPSNVDPRYLRTSVRRDVLPLLSELDPKIVHHLAALADELIREEETPAVTSPDWTKALPRATQEALAKMAESPSLAARVWLPGGLVASVDPQARTKGVARPRTRVVRPRPRG
jgi:tRNA(Ile)-lysidine synthase